MTELQFYLALFIIGCFFLITFCMAVVMHFIIKKNGDDPNKWFYRILFTGFMAIRDYFESKSDDPIFFMLKIRDVGFLIILVVSVIVYIFK